MNDDDLERFGFHGQIYNIRPVIIAGVVVLGLLYGAYALQDRTRRDLDEARLLSSEKMKESEESPGSIILCVRSVL